MASQIKDDETNLHAAFQTHKDEALALAERICVNKAAEQLGLHASQLYGWKSKQQ